MSNSKRKDIIQYIISSIKEIDGGVSTFDPSYTFQTSVYNNVFRGNLNVENINDFPTIQVIGGPERYNYNTIGNTNAVMNVLLRCFLHNGDRSSLKTQVDNLIQDIDHVIYKMRTDTLNIQTIHITSVDSDQGLLEDYSVIEIMITVNYELGVI